MCVLMWVCVYGWVGECVGVGVGECVWGWGGVRERECVYSSSFELQARRATMEWKRAAQAIACVAYGREVNGEHSMTLQRNKTR